ASPTQDPSPPSSSRQQPRPQEEPDTTLTPVRAHYLKKTLIQLQFSHELAAITSSPASALPNLSTLSYLGPPFSPPPQGAPALDLPFLRYIFRQFVLTFPFLAAAPRDFFPDKVQPFVASVLARNLSSPSSILGDGPDSASGSSSAEDNSQKKIMAKLERSLALFINYATKIAEREEVVRLAQADLDRLELLARRRRARLARMQDVFDVNIVCVRTVVEKGRVRSRVHEEFIIRTRRSRAHDVYVSRRYGDFRTLADELRKAHPEETVRAPPAKDRAPSSTLLSAASTDSPPPSPGTPQSATTTIGGASSSSSSAHARLAREKNRLTLRAYLHALLSTPAFASSPVLHSFLTSGPTMLSHEELADAARREEADRVREDGRARFASAVAGRVDKLRESVKGVKGDIMGKDGLTQMFAIIKTTENVRELPPDFQAVLEWARISLASTVFQHFVAADDASETLAGLKRIHGLMPYFMLKTALRISNPVGMIRSVLDLFLAQPFGGRSLLQRMFTSSLNEEVKALEEDIEAVKDKVEDGMISEKVRQYVYAPREIQDVYKADAAHDNVHVLAAVLRASEDPALSRAQMHRIVRGHRAHVEYMRYRDSLDDSDDDDGPPNEDAWLFEDLSILAKLYARLREKEQLIALIFEGVTAELLKDIITIFYAPLAQVYRAASIADSLGDLQNFINDLIRTVESAEELSQTDPQQTVQTFIDLIQRHEQSFYHFVHKVHSKGESLFNDLMRWIELFLAVIREGLGAPVSLEFLLPHTGPERAAVLAEVDAVALYHYKLKIAYESKIRRRFAGGAEGGGGAGVEDEAAQALMQGVLRDLSYGELMRGDAEDAAAEDTDESGEGSTEYETDEEDEEEDEDEDEDGSTPSSPRRPSRRSRSTSRSPRAPSRYRPARAPRQRPHSRARPARTRTTSAPAPQKQKRQQADALKPPDLQRVPDLLPIFLEMVR
ncbi:hypothetical protein HETIRDRAFT_235512, partial [Heterobasidion irregulare TC 32-1]